VIHKISQIAPNFRYVDEIPEISDYQYTKYQRGTDIVDVRGFQMAVEN
jgi:hypothetical protein